jgi:DNA-3-methyladenine glycosylase II
MKIALAVDGPLDVRATLARYRLWGEDPANRLLDGAFLRVFRSGDRRLPYVVRWNGSVDDVRLGIDVPRGCGSHVADGVTAEVRRLLGLDFDLPGFYRFAEFDPILGALIGPLYGLRPTLTPGGLEMLVGAITAQQVNLAFALTLRGRVVRRYGSALRIGGETVYAFPDAAALARARVGELRSMQFSTRKAEYIRDLARAVVAGDIDFTGLGAVSNADVVERLTSLRGMGRWTAEWFLARCLGRGDVCPAGDLAVRKAFAHYYGRGRALTDAAIRRRARAWGAHQTIAVHYLLAGMRRERAAVGGGA